LGNLHFISWPKLCRGVIANEAIKATSVTLPSAAMIVPALIGAV
jgi:hypothetical protein